MKNALNIIAIIGSICFGIWLLFGSSIFRNDIVKLENGMRFKVFDQSVIDVSPDHSTFVSAYRLDLGLLNGYDPDAVEFYSRRVCDFIRTSGKVTAVITNEGDNGEPVEFSRPFEFLEIAFRLNGQRDKFFRFAVDPDKCVSFDHDLDLPTHTTSVFMLLTDIPLIMQKNVIIGSEWSIEIFHSDLIGDGEDFDYQSACEAAMAWLPRQPDYDPTIHDFSEVEVKLYNTRGIALFNFSTGHSRSFDIVNQHCITRRDGKDI